jgi:ammonia channel protein AmtB
VHPSSPAFPGPTAALSPQHGLADPHPTDPSAGYGAGLAFTNTQLAPAMAMLTWAMLEIAFGAEGWGKGRPTAVGAATAAVVGLVGVTPAAGLVAPMWALFIGASQEAGTTARGV